MSRKSANPSTRKARQPKTVDRRVRQTRHALGDALIALMREKAFPDITVQHVLDRAGVSRSTFYTHYSDKNDLFLSDAEQFLDFMAFSLSRHGDKSNRVAPVTELFAHVGEMREFHGVLVAAGKMQDFLDLAQGYFARGIEQRLGELPGSDVMKVPRRRAMAQMFSGALVSLMSWWINQGMPGSPADMDEMFHQVVQASSGIPDRPASTTRRIVVRKR